MSKDPRAVKPLTDNDFEQFVKNLAQLSPAAPVRSRNQLLFEAGRASTRVPHLWAWQAAAIGFAALSLTLGLIILWPSKPQIIERERVVIQYRDREPALPAASASPIAPENSPYPESAPLTATLSESLVDTEIDQFAENTRKMLRLRNEVLRFGVEMLPRAQSAGEVPATPKLIEDEVTRSLYLPRGTFTAPVLQPRRVVEPE